MERLRALHHDLRSDLDFVSCQKGRVRLDQSVIHCNSPASTMGCGSRCYFKCFIHERLGECGRRCECRTVVPPEHGTEKMAERLSKSSHLGWQLVV